jgi:hypothetical protein
MTPKKAEVIRRSERQEFLDRPAITVLKFQAEITFSMLASQARSQWGKGRQHP